MESCNPNAIFISELTSGCCSVLGQSVLPLPTAKYPSPVPSFWDCHAWLLLLLNCKFSKTSETSVEAARAWAKIQSYIFLLLCMSSNFLLDVGFCELYMVECLDSVIFL